MSFLRLFNDPAGWVFLGSIAVWLATEFWALFNHTVGDTFSERIWAWLAGRNQMVMWQPHIRLGRKVVENSLAAYDPAISKVIVVRKGIKLNTFRWFAAAWTTAGLFVWLWGHFFLGWWAG